MLTVLVFAVILLLLSNDGDGVDGVKIRGTKIEKDDRAVDFRYYWPLHRPDIMVKSEDGVPYVADSSKNDIIIKKRGTIKTVHNKTNFECDTVKKIFKTGHGNVHIRGQGNDPKGRCETVLDQRCCLRPKCANLVTQAFVDHGNLYYFMNRCLDHQQHLVYRIELSDAELACLKQHVCSGEIERNELENPPAPPVAPAAPAAPAAAEKKEEKKKEKVPEASTSAQPGPSAQPAPAQVPMAKPSYMGYHSHNYGMHHHPYGEWPPPPPGFQPPAEEDNNGCGIQ